MRNLLQKMCDHQGYRLVTIVSGSDFGKKYIIFWFKTNRIQGFFHGR